MLYNTKALLFKVEEYISSISFDKNPETLYKPVSYILSLGGKRIRPLLTLMAGNLFKDNIDELLKPAAGIEIFHNFTLLHDDLMDNSDMRRGKKTVHKKWDANTAILSGDTMLIEAYRFISDIKQDKLPEILDLFSGTAVDVCKGQQYDMDFETRTDVSESEYLEMIRLKTAVLIACSLKTGAILADAPQKDAELLYDFGINIGLAFQIKDDLLDVYGDSKTFGKNVGDDIVTNKKTFLLIKSLELANETQKRELLALIGAEEFDHSEKIKAVKNIYNELNLKTITEKLAENYYIAALEKLDAVNLSKERKRELTALAKDLMNREK